MKYNFDEIIERRGTYCVKHDGLDHFFGRTELMPMWVADMDFRSPDFVMNAIRERCSHEVLGYHMPGKSYFDAVKAWLKKHYAISATEQELHFVPGIVAGISFVVQAFTNPGDSILVMTPVYPPFLQIPSSNGRNLVCSPLTIRDGRFAINFEDLERKATNCKLMIMSNPHNPGGTVWSREDLERIAEICHRNGLVVIADEIHADLTLPPHSHISFPTVSKMAADCAVMFMAPSKTFNIAGLGSSVAYVTNETLRKRFYAYLDNYGVAGGNIFAFVAAEAAFCHGEEWLAQMLEYLNGNVHTVGQFLSENMPKVKAVLPEASYLVWLDFTDYGFSHEETKRRLMDIAHVALNDGTSFGGEEYSNCFRLNIGCPQATLLEALSRICTAFNK